MITSPTTFLIFVQHTAASGTRSGVQRVTVELVRALSALRDVACVKWDAIEGQLRFADAADLEALFDGPPPPGLSVPPTAWSLRRRFGDLLDPDRRYSLIFPEIPFHLPDGNEMLSRLYSQCRDYGVAVASIFYDLIPITHEAYVADRDRHLRYVAEMGRHDAILAISRFSARELTDYFGDPVIAARIAAVPLPDLQGDVAPQTLPADEAGRDTILMLGTVEPRKGQLAALRAFQAGARASAALSRLRVVVIGSLHPAVADELHQLARQDARIDYRGYCSDDEVEALYDRALFTIFASRSEGFGLPIAESLAHGVPAICADFGAMAEVADGGGCLTVDVRDEAALAAAQVRLAEDGALRATLRDQIAGRVFRTWQDYGRDIIEAVEAAAPTLPAAIFAPIETFAQNLGDLDPAQMDDAAFEAALAADTVLATTADQAERFADEVQRRGGRGLSPPRVLTLDPPSSALDQRAHEIAFQARVAQTEHAHAARLAALPPAARRPVLLRIVISTYNRGPFVSANVDWLLRKVLPRHADLELVVVDNASTDDTEVLLARFVGAPRFRYLRNTANVGMLGNLGVCSTLPGAEYVWMIGDDDFIVPDQVAGLVQALRRHFGVPLAVTNFGVFHRERMGPTDDPSLFVAEAQPLASSPRPSGLASLVEAAGQHDNLFTAIYPIIWRADLVAAAFNHPFDGTPFGDLTESIPSTDYILRTLGACETYWHAPVGIAGNAANSWSRHRPRWHSVLMPMALELARDAGVDPVLLKSWASVHRGLYDEAMRLAAAQGWPAPTTTDADRVIARRVLGLSLAEADPR